VKGLLNKLISAVLFSGIIAAVAVTIYIASAPKIGEKFTEFYILGPSGKAQGYPTNLKLGESGTVILGVVNHEYEEKSYKIVVKLENETIESIDNIILNHDARWEYTYTFTPKKAGIEMKLDFLLYVAGVSEPYRRLHLLITVYREG
jgi:uncharacterized membrane protein